MTEKLERFERLAEKRVTETIKKIRLIGNLANRRNYKYTDDHVRQIIEALEQELRFLKSRFREDTTSESYSFSFKKKS